MYTVESQCKKNQNRLCHLRCKK